MKKDNHKLEVQEIRNPDRAISPNVERALKRRRQEYRAALQKEQAHLVAARPSELIRTLQQETTDALRLAILDLDVRRQQYQARYGDALDRLRPVALPLYPGPHLSDFTEGTVPQLQVPGRFEWISSEWSGDMPGISIENPDRFLHFFGHYHYEGDNLLARSAGVRFDFELDGVNPYFATTRWASTPYLHMHGIVSGWTGDYHPIWHADDKWCKCNLVLKQSAFQLVGTVERPLGAAEQSIGLFDLDNEFPVGQANKVLSGSLSMPRLEFELPQPNAGPVLVSLDVRFHMQLEGDAEIWFRLHGGSAAESAPSLENAVLVEVPEWRIQAIL